MLMNKLEQFQSWNNLKKETRNKILQYSLYSEYADDTLLYLETEAHSLIYFIISGYVILSKISPNGKEKYLYYLSCGDFINQCAIDEKVTTTNAKALKNTCLISMDKEILIQLMKKDFQFNFILIKSLALTLRRSQRQIFNLGVYSISQRTASKLLKLSRDYGKKVNGYVLIDAPLNQTDLSYMVGASREGVNRFLKVLENKKVIAFKGHKIAIIDRNKLLDYMK